MLRLLAFILLFLLLFRVVGYVMRLLLGRSTADRASTQFRQSRRRPAGGNINIDYVPGEENRKDKKYEGGEYVDYEEVDGKPS